MKATVFYSWQSDLKSAANRSLIQAALEGAVAELKLDDSISVEPVVDRDTDQVPGAPGIGQTIFEKIDAAAAFVADVTLVTPLDHERPSPNPNVLLELGYALKALGENRVVLVFNEAFGKVEALPFD